MPRAANDDERAVEQRARDAAPPPCRVDDEAHDRRGLVRRHVELGGTMREARAGVRQLVVRLRVQPADDVAAGVGEKAFHLAGFDARASSRCGSRAVERLPGESRSGPGSSGNSTSPTRGLSANAGAALVIEECAGSRRARAGVRRSIGHARPVIGACVPGAVSADGQRCPALISVHILLRSRRCAAVRSFSCSSLACTALSGKIAGFLRISGLMYFSARPCSDCPIRSGW